MHTSTWASLTSAIRRSVGDVACVTMPCSRFLADVRNMRMSALSAVLQLATFSTLLAAILLALATRTRPRFAIGRRLQFLAISAVAGGAIGLLLVELTVWAPEARLQQDAWARVQQDAREASTTLPRGSVVPLSAVPLSLLIHSYSNRLNAPSLLAAMRSLPEQRQVLVSVDRSDSQADAWAWVQAVFKPDSSNATSYDAVLVTGNVHEIRAYNRLAALAVGRLLVFLQGDYGLPATPTWWMDADRIFGARPQLGLLGGYNGHQTTGMHPCWGVAPYASPIDTALEVSERGLAMTNRVHPREPPPLVPLRFVQLVSLGPLIARREVFSALRGFREELSRVAEPGIGLDTDLALRTWASGWAVAVFYSGVANGIGGRHTLADSKQRKIRLRNEKRNKNDIERALMQLEQHANLSRNVERLNRQLRLLSPADAARLKAHADGTRLNATRQAAASQQA